MYRIKIDMDDQSVRIQKWLSSLGLASRREAETWIKQKKIMVNGKLASLGDKIVPGEDEVTINGRPVEHKPPPKVYWLLNKPPKFLTARKRQYGKKTIYDLDSLADIKFLVSPVGRLDFMTEGLLILSNDGEFVHKMTHPRFKVPRHYQVFIDGKLSSEDEQAIRRGITLEDGKVSGCELTYAHGTKYKKTDGRGSWYFITVKEGRNRLVRRMFEHFGHKVFRLIRTGYGSVKLPDDLAQGAYRQLTSEQLRSLRDEVGLN